MCVCRVFKDNGASKSAEEHLAQVGSLAWSNLGVHPPLRCISGVRAVYNSCPLPTSMTLMQGLRLDPENKLGARGELVSLYLDAGEAGKARALLDRFPDDKSTVFAWSRALIEYLSWAVLEEEVSCCDTTERHVNDP